VTAGVWASRVQTENTNRCWSVADTAPVIAEVVVSPQAIAAGTRRRVESVQPTSDAAGEGGERESQAGLALDSEEEEGRSPTKEALKVASWSVQVRPGKVVTPRPSGSSR
jgi:hypothetical protein